MQANRPLFPNLALLRIHSDKWQITSSCDMPDFSRSHEVTFISEAIKSKSASDSENTDSIYL